MIELSGVLPGLHDILEGAENLFLLGVRDAFWSCIAALGFAMLFNVPVRTLLWCGVAGAVGHAARALCLANGLSIETATLIGSTAIGFLALSLARRLHVPPPLIAISAAIPMVPGSFAYKTMIGLIQISGSPDVAQSVVMTTLNNGIKTSLILAAIGIGITSPTLLFRRHKPIV